MLPYLLHHANRTIVPWHPAKDEFYAIKDRLLRTFGKQVGYDVQHIDGKRCRSCQGTGEHRKYSWETGRVYEVDGCWRCDATGWYRLPIWICHARMQLGKYIFHRPLKRDHHVGNPYTKEAIGWEVTTNPVIEGYIEHEPGKYSWIAMVVILLMYDRKALQKWIRKWWNQVTTFVSCLRRPSNWHRWLTTHRQPKTYTTARITGPVLQDDDLPF